ncbi:hypothetical protein IW261DRAFT_1156588 [Armillaria novae-zelandiae]|nr:hypothetical protein IW261DRAFT_1156588 [Armillaria novae-zelandiae]
MYLVETGDNGAYKNVQLQLPFTDPKEAKRLAYCLTYCTGQPEEELYVSPCEPTPDACSQTFLYNGTDRSILPMNPGSSTTSGSSAETADVGDSEEDDGDEAYSTAIERRNETSTNVTMVFVPSGPVANDTEDASAEDDSDVSTVTVTETRTATVTATVTGDSTAVTTPTSVDSSSVPSVTSSSLKVEVYAPNAVAGSGSASSLEAASSTMDAPPSTSTDPVQVSSDSPISSAVSSTTSSTATVAARSQVTAASTEPYKWRFARK